MRGPLIDGRAWIYLIGYASGIVKVGRTNNPVRRFKEHSTNGDAVAWRHLFPHVGDGDAAWVERLAILALNEVERGPKHKWWKEVFFSLSKQDAITAARGAFAEYLTPELEETT